MTEATFTFRVDGALKQEFTDLARQEDRTAAQLLRGFMREYVARQTEVAEHDKWFRAQVQAGLEDLKAGRVVPAEQVEAEFAALRDRPYRVHEP